MSTENKQKQNNVADLESYRLLKDANNSLNEIMELATLAAQQGREDVLDEILSELEKIFPLPEDSKEGQSTTHP